MDTRAQLLLNALTNNDDNAILDAVLNDANILSVPLENSIALLEVAANEGKWHLIELIASFEHIDKRDTTLRFGGALVIAGQRDNSALIKTLLKAGVPFDWTMRDDNLNTPIHYAVINKRPKMLAQLLNAGAELTVKNAQSKTPIDLAETADQRAALNEGWNRYYSKLTLNNQLATTVQTKPASFILMALWNHNYEQIIKLSEYNPAILTTKIKDNQSFVWFALNYKRFDFIHAIADRLIKVYQETDQLNDALLIAVITKKLDAAENLLKQGASSNCTTVNAELPPLHIAIQQKNTDMITLLLRYHADLWKTDKYGVTAINLANSKPSYKTAFNNGVIQYCNNLSEEQLLAKVIHDNQQKSFIIMLLQTGKVAMLRKLLEHDATIPLTWTILNNKHHNNSLFTAIENNDIAMIALLLEYSASNIEAIDHAKTTKREDALKNGWNLYYHHLKETNKLTDEIKKNPLLFLNIILFNNNTDQLKDIISCDPTILTIPLKNNQVLMQYAAATELWKIVESIIEISITIKIEITRSDAALLYAVDHNALGVAKSLLNLGTPTTCAIDETGNGCLHTAIARKNPDMISLLLQFNASLEYRNKAGDTPEMYMRSLPDSYAHISAFTQGMVLYKKTLASKQTIPVLIQGQRQPNSFFYTIPDELIDKIGDYVRRSNHPLHFTREAKPKLIELSIYAKKEKILKEEAAVKEAARLTRERQIQRLTHLFIRAQLQRGYFTSAEAKKLCANLTAILSSNNTDKADAINSEITDYVNSKFSSNTTEREPYIKSATITLLLQYHLLDVNAFIRMSNDSNEYKLAGTMSKKM